MIAEKFGNTDVAALLKVRDTANSTVVDYQRERSEHALYNCVYEFVIAQKAMNRVPHPHARPTGISRR